jgi:hypothetical protein
MTSLQITLQLTICFFLVGKTPLRAVPENNSKNLMPTSQVRSSAMFILQTEEIKACVPGLVSIGIRFIGCSNSVKESEALSYRR